MHLIGALQHMGGELHAAAEMVLNWAEPRVVLAGSAKPKQKRPAHKPVPAQTAAYPRFLPRRMHVQVPAREGFSDANPFTALQ